MDFCSNESLCEEKAATFTMACSLAVVVLKDIGNMQNQTRHISLSRIVLIMKQTSVLEIKMVRENEMEWKDWHSYNIGNSAYHVQSMRCSKMNANCVISKERHRMQTDFINRFRYISSSE